MIFNSCIYRHTIIIVSFYEMNTICMIILCTKYLYRVSKCTKCTSSVLYNMYCSSLD